MKKKKLAMIFVVGVVVVMACLVMAADVTKIKKSEEVCRVIGIDVDTNEPVVSCFYGVRVDATRIVDGEEITNIHTLGFEEIYLGGTFVDGVYQDDGYLVGKFKKDFMYNDNADIFWKIEVGLNGSTLEYCNMRDQEYADTSRTKEDCESLYIDIM